MSRRFHFILHIGTEKTGTTTLQGYLHSAQSELNGQGVAYYASPGRVESRALAASAVGDQAPDDFLKQLSVQSPEQRHVFREQTKRHFHAAMTALDERIHTVVISSEHFHSRLRHPWQVKWLHDLITPWANDVQVVVYLRPQTDVLSSYYSTALKNGEVRSLEGLGGRICHTANHFYNYQMLLTLWGDIFGTENLLPRLFTPEDLIQQDIVADFFKVIGMPAPRNWNLSVPRQNESLNPLGQGLLRGINQAWRQDDGFLSRGEYKCLARRIKQVFVGSGERLPFDKEVELQSAFDASNQWVCEQWFENREVLFKPATPRKKAPLSISNEHLALVEAVIRGLSRAEVKGVPKLNRCADYLRDSAVAIEQNDIDAARRRMALAYRIRPQGPFIARKLEEYESQTGLLNKVRKWLPLGKT